MDFKSLATVFAALFLAEVGDKTQLAVLSFTSSGRPVWTVFLGASAALVASTAVAVLAGEALQRVVPVPVLRLGSALVFLVVGVLLAVEAVGELRGG